jgi:hypothetical protein
LLPWVDGSTSGIHPAFPPRTRPHLPRGADPSVTRHD